MPVILAGPGQAVLFLIVQLWISAPGKESVFPATNADVTQDSRGQTAVKWLTVVYLQTVADTVLVFP